MGRQLFHRFGLSKKTSFHSISGFFVFFDFCFLLFALHFNVFCCGFFFSPLMYRKTAGLRLNKGQCKEWKQLSFVFICFGAKSEILPVLLLYFVCVIEQVKFVECLFNAWLNEFSVGDFILLCSEGSNCNCILVKRSYLFLACALRLQIDECKKICVEVFSAVVKDCVYKNM